MGIWGTGNFDNDEAVDFRDDRVEEMIDEIMRLFEEGAADLDEGGEAVVMPSIEMLCVLCENVGASPPEPDIVEDWRDSYLELFDGQIAALNPEPGYAGQRRAVILSTFERLLRLAKVAQGES